MVITNDVSDSCQQIYVIAYVIRNHPVYRDLFECHERVPKLRPL